MPPACGTKYVQVTCTAFLTGYGKTTLLMQWHEVFRQQAPETGVAWLSLDEADGEPLSCLPDSGP